MSLLPTVQNANDIQAYFIENIGGAGTGVGDAPCIKGSTLGAVRVGDPANGLVIRGDTVANDNIIYGGQASLGSLTIGNSIASVNNIVLTDGVTTINTPLAQVGNVAVTGDFATTGNVGVGNNLIFVNGSQGDSISNYYSASAAIAGVGSVANPAGLTPGVYLVVYSPTTLAGNEAAEPSGVFYWSGNSWVGNAVSSAFSTGPPNAVIVPTSGSATLTVGQGGAGLLPVPGTLYFRKLMN